MKHKVVLLAAQGNEVESERLSGGPRRDTAIGFTGNDGVRRRQVSERDVVIATDVLFAK